MIRRSKIAIFKAAVFLLMMTGVEGSLYAQAAAGNPVINQAKAVYKFKTFLNGI